MCSFIIIRMDPLVTSTCLGVDPSLMEVVRIINMMDVWKPGTQDGNKVNVQAVLPVVFQVQRDGFQSKCLVTRIDWFAKRELDDLGAMVENFYWMNSW